MRKIVFLILVCFLSSHALSLNQIRSDLQKATVPRDSAEIKIRTTIVAPSVKQEVSVYIVQKGPSKKYMEIKNSFMNQRTIVNEGRMKVVNLNTRESQILPYNGEPLKALSYAKFNPLDSGEWSEPKFVTENTYSIAGEKGVAYYDSAKKRIEKFEQVDGEKSVLTTFQYNGEGKIKSMNTSVVANGVETSVTTEFLVLRSSAKFPDRAFNF